MAIKGSSKKTVKPPDVVRRILRGKLAGQTTAALARAEGVHRDTVLCILTLPEIRERMECARLRIVSEAEPMTPRLVDIVTHRACLAIPRTHYSKGSTLAILAR